MAGIRKKRRAYVEQRDCVACGCCVKVCPMNAIEVYRGLYARVKALIRGAFVVMLPTWPLRWCWCTCSQAPSFACS